MVLDVKVDPEMPRIKRKAVPQGNGPVPQDKSGLGGLTMEEMRLIFAKEIGKSFDRRTSHFDHEIGREDKEKNTNQRLAGLQHGVQ